MSHISGQDAGEVYNLEPPPEANRKRLQKKPVPSSHRTRKTVAEWQKTFLWYTPYSWWATIHGVTESDTTEWLSTHTHPLLQPNRVETQPLLPFQGTRRGASFQPLLGQWRLTEAGQPPSPACNRACAPALRILPPGPRAQGGSRADPLHGGNKTPPTGILLWWEVVRRQKGTLDFHCARLKRKQCEAVLHFCQDGICRHKQKFNIYTHPVLQLYLTVSERKSHLERNENSSRFLSWNPEGQEEVERHLQVRCLKQDTQSRRSGKTLSGGEGRTWTGGQDGGNVHPWLSHVDVRQKPQYCKVILLQLKLIN